MRDLIKDAKYYEDYLALNTKRLSRFQDQMKMLESDNVTGRQGCAAFIADLYRSRICALYSSGSCIHDIKELYPLYVEYLVQAFLPQEGYFDVIDAISLGVLLDAKDSLPKLKLILQQTNMRDKLTDTLLHSMDDTWSITESDYCCAWFFKFLECAVAERKDFLERYLTKKWYQVHRDAAWYNSHKSSANIYVGYWSFEVGAIAKMYGVQDSSEWPYYPYDMVHNT